MTMSVIDIIIIIAVVALIMFFALRKSMLNRNANRQERLRKKQEELFEMLREKPDNDQKVQVSDTTGDE